MKTLTRSKNSSPDSNFFLNNCKGHTMVAEEGHDDSTSIDLNIHFIFN